MEYEAFQIGRQRRGVAPTPDPNVNASVCIQTLDVGQNGGLDGKLQVLIDQVSKLASMGSVQRETDRQVPLMKEGGTLEVSLSQAERE